MSDQLTQISILYQVQNLFSFCIFIGLEYYTNSNIRGKAEKSKVLHKDGANVQYFYDLQLDVNFVSKIKTDIKHPRRIT